MRLPRRQFLRLVTLAAVLPAMPSGASGKGYPTRSVRIVVPTAAGGPADIIARLIGQWLSDRLGQTFVVENRPGAGGTLGTEAAVKAPADGYTLLLVSSSAAINATLYDKLNYNFIRDVVPIAAVARVPSVMTMNLSVPAKTVPEFITYAKANPGKINMGSSGIGSASHMNGELLKMMAGIDMVHVPYRGIAPALTDLLAGQLQVLFVNPGVSVEYLKAGKLRALAITTATRSGALPDIPTIGEFVPGYEASLMYGLGAPRNAPAEIVDKINKEINAGLADPKIMARLGDLDGTVLAGTPTDFGRIVAEETEKWATVVRAANIKA